MGGVCPTEAAEGATLDYPARRLRTERQVAPSTRQTVAVSHAVNGRHRAPATAARKTPWALATVAALLVGVVLAAAVTWWATRSPDTGGGTAERTPQPSTATATTSAAPTAIESTRDVRVDGTTVTIEEVSNVVEGDSAVAEPTGDAALGLTFVRASVVTPDGRSRAFESPITLSAGGVLTVLSRYRLTHCPDLLPSQWPSSTAFQGATRSFLRIDGPLHTAYALCPRATSSARPLAGLGGTLADGSPTSVRLTWRGSAPLTVRAIGSASGVAALAPTPSCDGACIAEIPARSSGQVQLQPVDPCPPATRSDMLTLVVGDRAGRGLLVGLRIPGLHRQICR